MTKELVCTVYYSNARCLFDTSALSRLLATSRRNNGANGLTGMLLFHDGNFIQALEGPRDSVADHPSISWRLLNSFREGVRQTG